MKKYLPKIVLIGGVLGWVSWYLYHAIYAPCTPENQVADCNVEMLIIRPVVMGVAFLIPALLVYWILSGKNRIRRSALSVSLIMLVILSLLGLGILFPGDPPSATQAEVTEGQALQAVREIPEVRELKHRFAFEHQKPLFIDIDREEENAWKVHVYEVVGEWNKGDSWITPRGHTATYGWYSVDKTTGVIYDDLNFKQVSY